MGFHEFLERLAAEPAAVDLSTGSPLELPEIAAVLRAGVRALPDEPDLASVLSSYTQLDGLDRFRGTVAELMSEHCGHPVTPAQVLPTPGVQAALRYVLAWLDEDGRRALYPTGLEFPGATARRPARPPAVGPHRMRDLGDGTWRPVLDVDAVTDWDGVAAVVLSWPHSPTGCDWNADEIGALSAAAVSHGAVLILDETYAPPFAPIARTDHAGGVPDGVVRLFSMSKLGLAGERAGFAVGPPALISQLARQQRRFLIQPPKLGQLLTLALLRAAHADPGLRSRLVALYRDRWQAGWSAATEVGAAGVRVSRWEGGLFLWLEWDGGPTDTEVAEHLLAAGVAVMPGDALRVAPPGVGAVQGLRIGLGADPDAVATAARGAAEIVGRLAAPPRAAPRPRAARAGQRRPFAYLDFCFYAFCNFTCTYCRETNEGMSKGAGRDGFDRAIKDFLADNEAAVLKLSGYGEATLWPELAEAVEPWAAEFPTVQLISNGAGPRAVYDRLSRLPNFQACVTLDGHLPELDRFRTKGSATLHGRVVRTVDRLVDAGVPVELNCVLSSANADHLDEYLRWIAERWRGRAVLVPFPVRPTLGRDPAEVREELSAAPAQVDAIEAALVERHAEHASVLAPRPYAAAVVAFMRAERRVTPCHVHRANFGVNTDLLALACACAGDRLIAPLGPVSAAWTRPDVRQRQERYLVAGNVGAKCDTCFTHYDVINLYLEGVLSAAEVARLPSLSTPAALRTLDRIRAELRPHLHRAWGSSNA